MTSIVMAGPKTPEAKAKATGIPEKYFRPLEQEREKPVVTHIKCSSPTGKIMTQVSAYPARECSCGGCCIADDNYVCPRCGRQQLVNKKTLY